MELAAETSARQEVVAYLLASLTIGHQSAIVIQYTIKQELIIGRQSTCNFEIPHPACSNTHCRIYSIVYEVHHDPLIYCEDLSMNGTFLNGQKIGKGVSVLLSHGDKLEIKHAATFKFYQLSRHSTAEKDTILEKEKHIFSNHYTISPRFIGGGAYGKVFMAWNTHTHRQLACKIVELKNLSTGPDSEKRKKRMKEMFMREVDILKNLNHPNIISVHKAYSTNSRIYIFEDLITGGDLFSLITARGSFEETEAMPVVWQILKALEYLHGNGIAHRDLKPDNILCTSTTPGSRIVLTDFGAAKHFIPLSRMTSTVGTAEYTAPEIVPLNKQTRTGYSKSVDLWSLGVIVYVLLSGASPFVTSRDPSPPADAVLALARKGDLSRLDSPAWQHISPDAKDFIRKLICVDPNKRLTVSGAKTHRWLSRHVAELDAVYERAIRGWVGRRESVNVLEEFDTSSQVSRGHKRCAEYVEASRKKKSIEFPSANVVGRNETELSDLPDLIFDSFSSSILQSIEEASEEEDEFDALYTPEEEELHADVVADGRLRNAREFELQVARMRAERNAEKSEYFECY